MIGGPDRRLHFAVLLLCRSLGVTLKTWCLPKAHWTQLLRGHWIRNSRRAPRLPGRTETSRRYATGTNIPRHSDCASGVAPRNFEAALKNLPDFTHALR